MANLYEILDSAHEGEAIDTLGRQFGLKPEKIEAAVSALLPAISSGLKRSTSTVDGLGNLFALMGQQQNMQALYDDAETALGPQGVAAGNDVLSLIFGSPNVSQAVVDQAQKFSGVDSNILKKLLPVLAGILVAGLTRSGSSSASPQAPAPSPAPAPSGGGGGLGDILGQIFGRALPGSPGGPAVPPSAPIPSPSSAPPSVPADTGEQQVPGGDLLGYILREMEKGIREGRIKPVVIGPMQIPIPGGQVPSPGGQVPSGPGAPQIPGGDIFGQILRDIFGGAIGGPGGGPGQMPQGRQGSSPELKDLSDRTRQINLMGGAGAAVFGDQFEHGQDVDQSHLDSIQGILDRFLGAPRR